VVQSTCDYDARTDRLTLHRSKEVADYRYFADPHLVPVAPAAELIERIRAELPELPRADPPPRAAPGLRAGGRARLDGKRAKGRAARC
jgi:hypothetical protein